MRLFFLFHRLNCKEAILSVIPPQNRLRVTHQKQTRSFWIQERTWSARNIISYQYLRTILGPAQWLKPFSTSTRANLNWRKRISVQSAKAWIKASYQAIKRNFKLQETTSTSQLHNQSRMRFVKHLTTSMTWRLAPMIKFLMSGGVGIQIKDLYLRRKNPVFSEIIAQLQVTKVVIVKQVLTKVRKSSVQIPTKNRMAWNLSSCNPSLSSASSKRMSHHCMLACLWWKRLFLAALRV